MIQQACNTRGTLLELLDAVNEASTQELQGIRNAIVSNDVREVGRRVTQLYEDHTYRAFADTVAANLDQHINATYYPDHVGYALECTV